MIPGKGADTGHSVTTSTHPRSGFRVHGRSYLVLVLRPEPPVDQWLGDLDAQVARTPSFLVGRPVVIDLGGVPPGATDLPSLVQALSGRGLRIIAVEGADPSWPGAKDWGTPIPGGRANGVVEFPTAPASAAAATPAPPAPVETEPAGLVLGEPVRSGQSIVYPKGDVTVLGSIASGAEVFAGGSIHVYGTLRGRAVAGFTGNALARVFCHRLEAELIAVAGVYRTAESMDAALWGRPAQAWLAGESVMMAALD